MKLRNILTNPYLLSMIPFIIIILIFPFNIKRYDLDLLRKESLNEGQYIYYDDIDNDSVSERISAFDSFNSSGLTITNDKGVTEQWNFHGTFGFSLKNTLFITGDRDSDGKKEIYVFTLSNDSIYLHCIPDITSPSFLFEKRFISTYGKGKKNPDPFILSAEMDDLNDDGTRELIFGIGTGFSYTPRGIFAYYIKQDSLVKSPEASYFLSSVFQADINGDSKKEILPVGYAAGNIEPKKAKYHDYSSYFMVLDRNLKFLFEPLEFKGKYSFIFPLKPDVNSKSIRILYVSAVSAMIFNIGMDGTKIDSARYDSHLSGAIVNDDEYAIFLKNKGYALYNGEFNLIRELPSKNEGFLFVSDADNDGINEYLIYHPELRTLFVYRKGLRHPASIQIEMSSYLKGEPLSVRFNKDNKPGIVIQSGKTVYELSYFRNNHFYYGYAYYIFIYLSILGFAFIIRHFQHDQLRKRYENEKKISELQLALIRNQLDPHFTLNAINSIIYSVDYGDRNQAAERLRCFAALYRDLVLSAGSSRRSIEEEINFCENYLELEKMRFEDKFSYEIIIADDVNMQLQIPKFLIQIHAENALKHGLAPLESGGVLNIELKNTDSVLQIEIQDNGVGRKNASLNKGQSTGKGLEIMNELYSLYNKYYSEKIEAEIIDLSDNDGKPSGTRVIIKIKRSETVVKA